MRACQAQLLETDGQGGTIAELDKPRDVLIEVLAGDGSVDKLSDQSPIGLVVLPELGHVGGDERVDLADSSEGGRHRGLRRGLHRVLA